MENQIVLILGLAFVAALGFILKQANTTPAKEIKERLPRKVKAAVKPKKQSQKKSQRKVAEWVGVDTAAKDAQDMLEFLKGKDPKEISKALKAQQAPVKKAKAPVQAPVQQNKKGKNQKQEVQSEDSSSDVDQDGFAVIQKKAPKQKKDKKKNNKEEEPKKNQERSPRVKSFFKGEEEEKKKERAARAQEKKERPEGEKRERKERPPREKKAEGEENPQSEQSDRPPREKRERKERPEGEQKEKEKRVIVAPSVPKHETADIDDILASFTKDFKSKQRESSLFSKIPRNIVVDKILPYLNAKELLYLSRVNQYFKSATKKESLWKALYVKEFGSENIAGIRSFKREYRKRKTGKDKKAGKPQE